MAPNRDVAVAKIAIKTGTRIQMLMVQLVVIDRAKSQAAHRRPGR